MYVTRPCSLYRNFPGTLPVQPPRAPYSAYVVITDEESEERDTFCWGLCKSSGVRKLPFPQDRILKIVPSSEYEEITVTKVWFIPVLDQPLSSNRYYVIKAKGKYKGKAYTCSTEDDIGACCFSNVIIDEKPRPFNHRNIYQQVEIHRYQSGGFYAKSVAHDGIPPKFLRRKGWEVFTTSFKPRLREAEGVDSNYHLSNFPELNAPLPSKRSTAVVIGKWYTPFVFVKERARLKRQMNRSLFYEVTLEQWWEEIYSCENESDQGTDIVIVNANVQREVALVYGMKAVKDDRHGADGFIWFKAKEGNYRRRGVGVGVSLAIVEKMRWMQERGGWVDGEVRVERVEEFGNERSDWRRFGCYVLVQSFATRRMDGSLVLKCNFRHTHQIQCKWE